MALNGYIYAVRVGEKVEKRCFFPQFGMVSVNKKTFVYQGFMQKNVKKS